ncbi:hypothetical protein AFLA70_74g003281 [Aspergillus flavus AF70]|nr:hypothetical protein AFLA70_74g003281 [Aspergillus flavus AF70]
MTASRRKSKSRHGCFQCKRRSIKCDEKRPQCSNCENRRDILSLHHSWSTAQDQQNYQQSPQQ